MRKRVVADRGFITLSPNIRLYRSLANLVPFQLFGPNVGWRLPSEHAGHSFRKCLLK